MGFCPRCGASTTPATSFCTGCGESLAPTTSGPAASPAAPATSYGPPGATREPWLVLLLTVVTLGIYTIFYWWSVSKEVDAHAGQPGHSHSPVKIGILIGLAAGVVMLITLVSFMSAFLSMALAAEGEPDEAAFAAAMGGAVGGILGLIVAGMVGLAGTIVLLVGKYRIWTSIEDVERARQHATPLSAGLLLGLTIAGVVVGFLPFVGVLGIAFPLIVLYMTTDHLNQVWRSAAPPPPAPPQPA